MTIDPKEVSTADLHQYLLGSVSPRPICFASTVNEKGQINLAPYSFFNAFSSNPPTIVFSSNRRVKDNTTKDTLHNVMTTKEVVINVVNYEMVRQMSITSIDYPTEVSEFVKAGFTPIDSDIVKAPRVKESPVSMECIVKEVISLGETSGAGNLIVCEVVKMHINDAILDEDGKINPHKIDLVGRMGRAFYVRASGESVFNLYQPVNQLGIGYDNLPEGIKTSSILTGNEIAEMAALPEAPNQEIIDKVLKTDLSNKEIHEAVSGLIDNNQALDALAFYLAHE